MITIGDMFRTLIKKEFYLDILVMAVIAIAPVFLGLFFVLRFERALGIKSFIGFPVNLVLFFIFFITGAVIVWRAYTYLVIAGEGGPNPQLGGTKKLVTTGPYALVRHPSVVGKLFGVIGVGFLFNSAIFLLIVIPILLFCSVLYNRFIQEQGCVDKFKDEYLAYRKQVPMIIPRFGRKIR